MTLMEIPKITGFFFSKKDSKQNYYRIYVDFFREKITCLKAEMEETFDNESLIVLSSYDSNSGVLTTIAYTKFPGNKLPSQVTKDELVIFAMKIASQYVNKMKDEPFEEILEESFDTSI